MATEALLRAVVGRDAVRVIFASSSSVYGKRATGAMCETDDCGPLHPYGVSKLHAEQSLLGMLGNRCTALRLFTVYGPGQRSEMLVASAIRAAVRGIPMDLHDESVRRDLTYIDDVVNAMLAAALRPGVHGVINIGGGVARSIDDVLGLVTRHLDKEVPIKRVASGPQPPRTLADLARARALLDYQPIWSLSDGVARQIGEQHPTALRGEFDPG